MRHHDLRRVHRSARRATDQVVYGVRRSGQRPAGHDSRRTREGRQARSDPGRILSGARTAVRLLHARHVDDRLRAAEEKCFAERGRHPVGDLRESLPLHRLRQHCEIHPARIAETSVTMAMTPKTSPEIGGMGHSIKRKEDPRFLRGQGKYVDDVVLPCMLYLDIVRNPYAHAKIVKIDTTKAMAIPGVLAVVTGEMLKQYNLHWMPTLMSDTQMVLPVEKVMHQGQEVAAVLATTRYIAADGVQAVEVEYDPLPVVVDPFKALEKGATVLRTDKEGKKDNHIWHWEAGDRAATEKAFKNAEVKIEQDIYLPRINVAASETSGCGTHFHKPYGN